MFQQGFIVDERVISTILAIVFESPDSYLREIAQLVQQHTNVTIAPSTICHIMHKHGLTRKKIQHIAAKRNAIHQGDYIAEMSMYKAEMLVFADETGKDACDCLRRFGYALTL